MDSESEHNELTRVLGKITAALVVAFLAAAPTGSSAQTATPSPAAKGPPSTTSDVPASITLKMNGTSYVYQLSDSDKAATPGPAPTRHRHPPPKQFRCRWEFGGITCS
jgi:hypothetical protein